MGAARVEHPALRQPISLIVDDPMPGYNPAHFHSGFRLGPLRIPPSLIDRFADLVEETGIQGKFSVVPYPFGFGRVDREVQGVSQADLRHFLEVVRERIAPHMDITPEVLTHWNALDLQTGRLLPLWEHLWSREQTHDTLAPYLSLALEILNGAGLPCSGMTSPWNFGEAIEATYAEALLGAQRAVNDRRLTWYFLHSDPQGLNVTPRLQILRPARAEAVVSIVCCDGVDFGQPLWRGEDARPDDLIGEDGDGGRLAQVILAGGPAVFHTHWQTIFGFGTARGLDALRAIAGRVQARFADRVAWVGCRDLAEYAAAAAAVEIAPAGSHGARSEPEQDAEGAMRSAWRVTSPFRCRRFTLSLACPSAVRKVRVDETPIRRAASRADLEERTYLLEQERLYVCWPLEPDQILSISY